MDTSETRLEKIIVDWLRDHNGYEQETPHAYNQDFALVDKWVENVNKEIENLKEYKQRLISDVVTGQIKVW